MTLASDELPNASRQGQGGGPKTRFGKEASSKNSTTHGLSARFVRNLPDSFQNDVNEQMTLYVAQEQPQTAGDMTLCGLAALSFVQHREAVSEIRVYLAVRSFRAQTAWEVDRIAETAKLGARLANRPEIVAAELGQTLYGVLWLLERWKYLGACLDTSGKWLDEDVSLAYDLIGRDPMMRSHDPDRLASGDVDFRREFVKGRIAHLESLVNGPYRNLDQILQGMAVKKEHYLDDPAIRRLIRLENRALRTNREALKELERRRTARGIDSYAPDGSIANPPPGPDDPVVQGPGDDYQPVFYQAEDPVSTPVPKLPAAPSRPVRNESGPQPQPRRTAPTADQLKQLRKKAEDEQLARRREKEKAKAERKAARAARKRNR